MKDSDKEQMAVTRALEIVNAVEWSGDMRVNMTTIIGAGRVLAKALARRDNEVAFYRDRCNLLQKINHECPEPFRTKLCNVLANGTVGTGVQDRHFQTSRFPIARDSV